MESPESLRLIARVAQLYYKQGVRQTEIAERLGTSQSRISRLLRRADDLGIVRRVVVPPPGVNSELEGRLEELYGLREAYVVDADGDDVGDVLRELSRATSHMLSRLTGTVGTLGFTSWSRSFRLMAENLPALNVKVDKVVETLGDLGPPELQHEAAQATQALARATGARPVFLRAPGVAPDSAMREALVRDPYVADALATLDQVDILMMGIGDATLLESLRSGGNYLTVEQFSELRALGAVGDMCLRFFDRDGEVVPTPFDDLMVGATVEQIRGAGQRWGVAGGTSKYVAIRGALRGRWLDVLVTDRTTAEKLVAESGSA